MPINGLMMKNRKVQLDKAQAALNEYLEEKVFNPLLLFIADIVIGLSHTIEQIQAGGKNCFAWFMWRL